MSWILKEGNLDGQREDNFRWGKESRKPRQRKYLQWETMRVLGSGKGQFVLEDGGSRKSNGRVRLGWS